ncbi:NAD-binding protein [Crucibulum laeve]|uniref:NAD-binding protein n=1 Tax=Crucibulum laeve TaxID=68775 RepID=A0A5C3LQG3_9AGAR|nr:NAD-binding protein [Crucibulum laeve]
MSTRILILGGTGPAGILLIREALDAYKHATLVVYARSPEKIPEDLASNPAVVIVKGQLDDADSLAKALEGVDIVVSALGPGVGHPANTPLAKGYTLLIDLMHKQGVKRLIALGTASIKDPHDKFSLAYQTLIAGVATLARTAYKDIVAVGKVIRNEGADLEWTIVRVPILTNKDTREVVSGYVGDGKMGTILARKAYAAFSIGEIEKKEWVKKAPLISNA